MTSPDPAGHIDHGGNHRRVARPGFVHPIFALRMKPKRSPQFGDLSQVDGAGGQIEVSQAVLYRPAAEEKLAGPGDGFFPALFLLGLCCGYPDLALGVVLFFPLWRHLPDIEPVLEPLDGVHTGLSGNGALQPEGDEVDRIALIRPGKILPGTTARSGEPNGHLVLFRSCAKLVADIPKALAPEFLLAAEKLHNQRLDIVDSIALGDGEAAHCPSIAPHRIPRTT